MNKKRRQIPDITDRIVSLVFRAQGTMTLDELCHPDSENIISSKIAGDLDKELHDWYDTIEWLRNHPND